MASTITSPAAAADDVRDAAEEVAHTYGRSKEQLRGYLAVMAAYAVGFGAVSVALARSRRLPERIGLADGLLLATATHKLSRTLAKDAVASPLRAPFTRFTGSADAPGEVDEDVRERDDSTVAGELISCPFCLDHWVGAAFVTGLVVAPRLTRFIASTFAVRAGADFLQFAYAAAERAAE